jgi:hypothetical protein
MEEKFSALIQTGPGSYPAYCTMSSGYLSQGKASEFGVDHLPPSSTQVKEKLELYFTPLLGVHGLLQGKFTSKNCRPSHNNLINSVV